MKKDISILIIILLLAGFLRFYNLMHDSPYFFNPDERNMANAITQFHFPDNLNPHFFAYGQFPLYLAFASDIFTRGGLAVLQGLPLNNSTSFPSAIFWLRFWSALFSIFTVLFVYLITNVIPTDPERSRRGVEGSLANARSSNKPALSLSNVLRDSSTLLGMTPGVIAALLAAFTPGLIQSAHFGTTESFLTFFFMASIYLSIVILRPKAEESRTNVRKQVAGSFASLRMTKEWKYLILLSLTIGLALGSKLTGIFFFIPPLISLLFIVRQRRMGLWPRLFENLIIGLLIIIGSISVFILSSPYNLIDFPDFKSAVFGYEADVAIGIYPAFYTRQFVDTTPIIFQVEKIFPYALGLPIFILGTIGAIILTLRLLAKSRQDPQIIILILSFLIYLLPNSFLFAKWTRFMTPVLPFFAIFAGYALFIFLSSRPPRLRSRQAPWRDLSLIRNSISDKLRDSSTSLRYARNDKINKLVYWIIGLLVLIGSITPGMAFMSIYAHEDTRVTASKWIYQNIPNNSYILSETANVVDIPLSLSTMNYELRTNNYTVISFDFYHVDKNPILFEELLNHLEKADYILIPSRRIFINYMRLPKTYPLITKYYQLLFSGRLGFEKVSEISSYPSLAIPLYPKPYTLIFPDEQSEETFTVFDHPVIRIYKKVRQLDRNDYSLLFNDINQLQ